MTQREDIDGKDNGLTSSSEDYLFGPAFGAGVKLNLSKPVVMNMDSLTEQPRYLMKASNGLPLLSICKERVCNRHEK